MVSHKYVSGQPPVMPPEVKDVKNYLDDIYKYMYKDTLVFPKKKDLIYGSLP